MSTTVSRIELVAGIAVAILASSIIGMTVSSQLSFGPKGDKGDTGPTGANGATGAIGANGATWWNGTGTPATSLGNNGDFYLDLATDDVYNKVSGLWLKVANIQGAAGATGPQGPPGPQGSYLPDYDSGWVDITDMSAGHAERIQTITLTHNLNSTNVIVDVSGKMTQADAPHQVFLGLGGYISGFESVCGGSGYSVVQTADGGYAVAGSAMLFGASYPDVYLVKTNHAGTVEWNKTYGGTESDLGYSVVQTVDRGYAIAGQYGGDVYLVKTDWAGRMEFNKTYGGGVGYSIVQTSDGGYAIAGYTYSSGSDNVLLIKTDAAGGMQWSQTYGGTDNDHGYSLVETNDGFAIVGETWFGSYGLTGDVYLVKTDQVGTMLWNRTYGGIGNDVGYSLVETDDGGYAIAGTTWVSWGRDNDVYLVKTDQAGTMLWNRTYGNTGSDFGRSIVQTGDGGFTIAGYTHSWLGHGSEDVYLVKTDAVGTRQWWMTFGGIYSDEYGYSIVETSDGGYAIVGVGFGGTYLIKTPIEQGLAWINTANSIVLYRGETDVFWNYVRVRIWKIE